MSEIKLDKEIKIGKVLALWKRIRESDDKVEIDCSNLKKTDGAGFQLLVYLFEKGYVMKNLSEEMSTLLMDNGYIVKGETGT